MQSDNLLLESYSLCSSRIVTNNKYPYTSFLLAADAKEILDKTSNFLEIQIRFSFFEPLNQLLKKKGQIIKIWLKNLSVDIGLKTKQGEYCFEEMVYYSFLTAQTNKKNDNISIHIVDLEYKTNQTKIQAYIQINRNGKQINEIAKIKEIAVEIGSSQVSLVLKNEINILKVSSYYTNKPITYSQRFKNKIHFISKDYSLPLGVFLNIPQIYSSFSIQGQNKGLLQKIIRQLPQHISIADNKDNKLFICHDMKGGYSQDINFGNAYGYENKEVNLRYRSFHLQQTEIFNYFSHHNITVPPKHWRQVCKRFGVKCLGTFIIESKIFDQNVLTSQQFAYLLVYTARKCKFDGYLINIQIQVQRVGDLKRWLNFLTSKIHQYIPNSTIVWYDSILAENGKIKYQNQLNRNNSDFYKATDGIFTNYWWNQQSLKNSIAHKNSIGNQFNIGRNKKIYIGNDCFGRNTYGGGKYDIYRATNKILEYKNQLQIALFAPGYTYQDECQHNRSLHYLNENSMYKGIQSKTIPIDNWVNVVNGGNGWKQEGDWAVTSHQVCERTFFMNIYNYYLPNSILHFNFYVYVQGTPPQTNDPYKIILQIVDLSNGQILYQKSPHNFFNCKFSQDKEILVIEEMEIDTQIIKNKPNVTLKIVEMGKDSQGWGGHFGVRFKGQKLVISIYDKERHWIQKISTGKIKIDSFHSYFNVGYGDHFYCFGSRQQENYDYLSDMDVAHTHIINHPMDTQFYFQDAFLGGSCLSVKKQNIKLLRLVIPEGLNLQETYYLQLAVKNTTKIEPQLKYITKDNSERIFSLKKTKQQILNSWIRHTYILTSNQKIVAKDIRALLDLTSQSYPYLLGEIKLLQVKKPQVQKIFIKIQSSREFLPTTHYFVNVKIQSHSFPRLLVAIEKNYSAFCYFQEGVAIARNIRIDKCESLRIRLIETDQSLDYQIIRDETISSSLLAKLIFDGFIEI